MAKAFQFDFLLQLAIEKRDEAAQAIGTATQRLQMARDRHAQIEQYRAEYRSRLTERAGQGMPMHQWNDFKLFIVKLDGAVEQQSNEVTRHTTLLEQAKRAWMECEKEVKAYEALRDRHDARQYAIENRQEQRLADEWAANLHRQGKQDSSQQDS